MKKMFILISAIMMAASNANAKNVETAPFTGVCINVPARVKVIQGDNYEVNVITKDSLVEKKVQCVVVDGVLRIKTTDKALLEEAKDLRITIVTPVDAEISAGRDMEMKIVDRRAENLDLASNN